MSKKFYFGSLPSFWLCIIIIFFIIKEQKEQISELETKVVAFVEKKFLIWKLFTKEWTLDSKVVHLLFSGLRKGRLELYYFRWKLHK